MNYSMSLKELRSMQTGLSQGVIKIAQAVQMPMLVELKEAVDSSIDVAVGRVFRDVHIWRDDMKSIDLEFVRSTLELFQDYAERCAHSELNI
jgi:hypothetical protein